MNVSSDIVNNSCVMSEVINNNKVQFSDHEGPTRIYFSSKEHVDRVRVNYYTKNNVLVDTIYCTVYYGIVSWVQYEFDDEFKFEFYE